MDIGKRNNILKIRGKLMSSKCILCDNGYDFRKIQVNEILGTVGIALASSLNSVTKSNAFKYCPVCGKKLTKDNFGGKQLL